MAGIYPRKDDKGNIIGWQAQVRKKGWPIQTKTFTSKRDAETWARRVEADIERGSFISTSLAERTTFKEVADRFAAEYAPHHYRGEGWRFKLDRLRGRLGAFSLAAITPQLVANYRDERLADPDPRYTKHPSPPPVSPATVKTEIDLLSKVLTVAQQEFGITLPHGNPVLNIRKPKDNTARERRLSVKEWERLMDACAESRNAWLRPAVEFAVETAMRQGEQLGLRWEDVHLARSVAILPMTKNGESRAVPLSGRAVEILRTIPRALNGKVFPLETKTLYSAFKRACGRAGIENYTWHDLRHESVSRWAERGDMSIHELAAISGHKTLQMLKRYTHLHAEKLAEKMSKIPLERIRDTEQNQS